ncbi:hypothetical protein HCA55_08945 [Listeria booriae]|uniref:Uncharacterized protein n=1 Tax=Listeria booriae TaxID=1552123 RepID=A0A842AZ19_9LIST|nr:hypothetical protein [Listeria booriae]MBC1796854.1 hypothetical protein [Listeria booriae]
MVYIESNVETVVKYMKRVNKKIISVAELNRFRLGNKRTRNVTLYTLMVLVERSSCFEVMYVYDEEESLLKTMYRLK